MTQQQTGADLIAAERTRQIAQEGYTLEHDVLHGPALLASAALAYLTHPSDRPPLSSPREWPWGPDSWKPSPDRVRELVKAGALVAAAIDALIEQKRVDDYDEHAAQVREAEEEADRG